MTDQIVSQPDHGDSIVLKDPQSAEAFIASPRLQLFFDDITKKLNDTITDVGAVITLYSDDDTIGSGRVAGITDTVTFGSGLLVLDETNSRVGISSSGVAPTDGTLHLIDSSAGSVAAIPTGDTLVLERTLDGGMSFLQTDGATSNIYFGSPILGNQAANIWFDHLTSPSQALGFDIAGLTAVEMLTTGVFVNPNQIASLDFQVDTLSFKPFLMVDSSADRLGLSMTNEPPSMGLFHIKNGDSGFEGTPPPSFDDIVFEGDTLCGFSFFAGNQHYAGMSWGDRFGIGDREFQASFVVKPDWDGFGNGRMEWRIDDGAATRLYLTDDTGFEVNPLNNLFSTDFRVHGFQNVDNVMHVATGAGQHWCSISNAGNGGTNTAGLLQLTQGGTSGHEANTNANILTLNTNTNGGMTILGVNGFTSGIYFATTSNNDAGRILFTNSTQRMTFLANGVNWLDIGASFIININQADVDFVARSVNSQQLIRTDAANDRVSMADVNVAGTDGLLHLIQGGLVTIGAITASTTANTLVLEGDGARGLSILVDNATGVGNIAFGDPTGGNLAAVMGWTASTGVLDFKATDFHFTTLAAVTIAVDDTVVIQDTSDGNKLKTVTTQAIADLAPTLDYTALIALVAAPDADWVFNESAGDFDWRAESVNSTHLLFLDAGNDRVTITDASVAGTDGLLHIVQSGLAGSFTPLGSADALVIESSDSVMGMTLACGTNGTNFIIFADSGDNDVGGIKYSHGGNDLVLWANTTDTLWIDTQGVVVNENGLAQIDFRAESDNHTHKLYLDSGLESLQVGAGTANTSRADIGGTLNIDNTTQGTTAITTEETLLSYSLIASSLTTDGRGVRIRAWGTTAANANLKTIKLKFGATNVLDTGAVASNGETWYFEADVYRTGAATQDAIGKPFFYLAGINGGQITTPAETLSGAITIAVSGQNGTAAANDIVAEGFSVEFI